jgi:hypothetical protein
MDTLCALTLVMLLAIVVLLIVTLPMRSRHKRKQIAEEHARARELALGVFQMVDDGLPLPQSHIDHAAETLTWIRNHPDRRLPDYLISLSKYEEERYEREFRERYGE